MRSVLAAVVFLVALGALEAGARAASRPIAEVSAETPISGGHGWLVWSAPAPGGWALTAYHAGTVSRLPVASAAQRFDAGVGTDASGAPAVVFTRCQGASAGEGAASEICRIHELRLGGGTERGLPIPAPARASDAMPAIWRGVVTFARRSPGHGEVMQVMSWSPRAPHRLRTLPHGSIPAQCRHHQRGCRQRPVQGTVTGLAADGSIVAFVWSVGGGAVGIDGASELRVDRTDGRGAASAGIELGHEACMGGGGPGHVLESVRFQPPFVSGSTASFGELDTFSCFTGFASELLTHGSAPGYASEGKLEVISLAVAQDEGQLYGLVPAPSTSWAFEGGPSCSAKLPCAIEALAAPRMKRDRRLPQTLASFYGTIE